MRASVLKAIRRTLATIDGAAVWLLSERRPLLAAENIEPAPTVPDYLQCRLAEAETKRAHTEAMIARLLRQMAEDSAVMAVYEAHERQAELQLN